MLIIIGIMLLGIATGYMLRSHKVFWINKIITLLIWLLLFFLGIEVGCNKNVINRLGDIGLDALIIAFAGVIGSLVFTKLLWVWISHSKKEEEK